MKKGLYFLCGIVALSCVLILSLPTLISTKWGQKFVHEQVNQYYPNALEFKDLQLSWFGPQKIENLYIKNQTGQVVFSSDLASTNSSLWNLIWKQSLNHNVDVQNGMAKLALDPQTLSASLLGYTHSENPILVNLSNLFIHLTYETPDQKPTIQAHGKTSYQNQEGQFNLHGTLSDSPTLEVDAVHFPSLLMTHFLYIHYPDFSNLAELFLQGPLDIWLKGSFTQNKWFISSKIDSQILQAQIEGNTVNQQFTLAKPAQISISLAPKITAYLNHYFPQISEILANPAEKFSCQVTHLTFPLNFQNLKNASLDANIQLPALKVFLHGRNDPLQINSLTASVFTQAAETNVNMTFALNGLEGQQVYNLQSQMQFPKPDSLLKTYCETIKDNLHADFKFSNLPAGKFTYAFLSNSSLPKYLDAFFGQHINGLLNLTRNQGNGPFNIKIQGVNGNLETSGKLNEQLISLDTPLQFQTDPNSVECKRVLSEFIPIFSHIMHADEPLKVTLSPDGFSIPLQDGNILNRISFKQGVASIGKTHFDKQGKIAQLLTLLNTSYQGTLSIWLTPLYFQAELGNFSLLRSDLLLDDAYHLAIWGDVFYPKDQLKMFLGIDGQALQKAWGISDLPSDQFLVVPVKGSLSSPSLDSAKIIAQFSAWKLQAQGNTLTSILGGALQAASGNGWRGEKIPPPTTQPFPWEGMVTNRIDTDQTQEIEEEEKKDEKKNVKKLIKEKAQSVIQNFLNGKN